MSTSQHLYAAITHNNPTEVKRLVGGEPALVHALVGDKSPEGYQQRPLGSAASLGRVEICEYLVGEGGSDVTARNEDGDTPLHCLASRGQIEA